jgi:uncharacterized protein YwqG
MCWKLYVLKEDKSLQLIYFCSQDSEISKLEEVKKNLHRQLQSALDDVGDKTTELEEVRLKLVFWDMITIELEAVDYSDKLG